jgi:hypothetical protein
LVDRRLLDLNQPIEIHVVAEGRKPVDACIQLDIACGYATCGKRRLADIQAGDLYLEGIAILVVTHP